MAERQIEGELQDTAAALRRCEQPVLRSPAPGGVERVLITENLLGLEEELDRISGWDVFVNRSWEPMAHDEFMRMAKDRTGIINLRQRIDRAVLESAADLRAIGQHGVGLDLIDLEAAAEHGVSVMPLTTEVTESTAELAIALMFACARKMVVADRWVRENSPFPLDLSHLVGMEITGKTLGLVGMGRIAQAVAGRARGLGMKIIYSSRTRRPEIESELRLEYMTLLDLLEGSDVVSLHLPGGEETRHVIGREELRVMKKTAILINTGRGSTVDEQALIEALGAGWIAGAGLDVFDREPELPRELIAFPNVVLTPHVGSLTSEARHQMTRSVVKNLDALLRAGQR